MHVARRTILGAGLGAGALIWPGFASAQSGPPRFGLVVGNTAYSEGIRALNNAGADADLIAETLRACGFTVPTSAVLKNAGRDALVTALTAHAARVRAAGPSAIPFFYYAGHGAAAPSGRNYLIPIVAANEMTDATWDECLELPALFAILGAPVIAATPAPQTSPGAAPAPETPLVNAHIVALDACRDTLRLPELVAAPAPLAAPETAPAHDDSAAQEASTRSPPGAYRNTNVRATHRNVFISYSTWEGQKAFDGVEGAANGPYALGLAAHLGYGGRSLGDTFSSVRVDVRRRTRGAQEPMNVSGLDETSHLMRIARVTAPVTAFAVAPGAPSDTQALVLGCNYEASRLPPLATTRLDCARMNDALRRSGFATYERFNANRDHMMAAVQDYAERLSAARGAGVGVLYFSGYGASANGVNYLVPQDARVASATDLGVSAVPVNWVLDTLANAEPQAVVLFLDGGRRFSPEVSPRAPQPFFERHFANRNVLLSFSQWPGALAESGPDGSIYSIVLAEEITRPERRALNHLMDDVRRQVLARTQNRQEPFIQSTIGARIYFRGDGTGQ